MALRKVIHEGDEILRKKAKPVEEFNEKIIQLLDDMYETMKAYEGVGLAAPQVGMLKKIVVIDLGGEEDKRIELINPEITESEGEIEGDEGCLSVPGMTGKVVRPAKVKVEALNRDGKKIAFIGEGMLARVLCHELDHLNGILYIDKAKDVTELE